MDIRDAVLDFRSDTVTTPTPAMREAMYRAEVGDDAHGEDPTVNRLEAKVAGLFGREAALFVPSGSMANLIGLALHCERGDEVIMERRTHSFAFEVGGGAALFGILFNVVDSEDGAPAPAQVEALVRPRSLVQPGTRLLVVENTMNLAGGRIVPLSRMKALREATRRLGLRLHVDGARIWNAAVATGVPLGDFAAEADTMSCCLSKGLGCPVGSLVVGDGKDIERARRLRRMLGGGMRQAGVLAACGIYAVENHVERLKDDHETAALLADGLARVLDGRFKVQRPETNMVMVHTDRKETTQAQLASWEKKGVRALALPSGLTIRLVTHLDLPRGAAAEAARRIASY